MSESKFTNVRCSKCGRPNGVINGEWLRARRVRARLTLLQMAQRLGFSAVYLSDIERGRRPCTARIREAYEALS